MEQSQKKIIVSIIFTFCIPAFTSHNPERQLEPRIYAVQAPAVANISCYCLPVFVFALCGKPQQQTQPVSEECPKCTNCSVLDLWMRFCHKGTLSDRFSSSTTQRSSEPEDLEDLSNTNYCENGNYPFKTNAAQLFMKSKDFKAQCQDEMEALCPSGVSKESNLNLIYKIQMASSAQRNSWLQEDKAGTQMQFDVLTRKLGRTTIHPKQFTSDSYSKDREPAHFSPTLKQTKPKELWASTEKLKQKKGI